MREERAEEDKELREVNLVDYYYLLRRRSWIVFSSLFLAVLLTMVFTFTMKPVYRATARIIIDKETSRSPLTGEQLDSGDYMSQQLTFHTHFKIITSRPVMEKVLTEVKLPSESFEPGLISHSIATVKTNLKHAIHAIFPAPEEDHPSTEEESLTKEVEALTGKIQIEEVRNTRLLNISVQDHDPQIAKDLANAIGETYIFYDSSTRLESSRKIMDWLSNQLYAIKKKVEDSEREFLAFKERENIFSLEGSHKISTQNIEEMNSDYIKARSQRLEIEAKIQALKKFIETGNREDIRNIPTFIKNELLESLFAELLNTEVEYQKISSVYRHKHPEMVKVTSKISELRSKIRQQIQKAMDNAEAERAVLLARENASLQATRDYKSQAIGTNQKELQYAILEREVDTNKQLYDTLLAKIKQTNVTDEITKSNLRLVEPATIPIQPIKPKKALNLTLSVVLGLFTGVGLAFFLEYLDQTIHNKEEAERYLDLPVLSEIPIEQSKKAANGSKDRYAVPVLTECSLNTHFSEAFRQLATNLRFSELNRPKSVYLVTSSNPKEGKSMTSLNLGLTMAHLGMKTLLIEADLRLPSMKKILQLPREEGLTHILMNTFSTATTEGTLDDLALADIHKLLEIQEKTGILRYRNGVHSFNVTFLKGKIIDVDWPTRPSKERLGTLLVQSGKITQEQADIAVAKQQATSRRLGQVLLDLGFLSVDELAGPLRLQIHENIKELYQLQHASFIFEGTQPLASPASDPKEAALIQAMGNIDNGFTGTPPFLLEQVQQQLVQVPESNLWILPGGKIPPNPAELLASHRMKVLTDLLRQQFDMIIVDSPPVATVSDATVLASLCDGVILLISASSTHIMEVQRAKEQLSVVQAPIVGTVINKLDFDKDPYYYGRYYYKRNQYYQKAVH